MGYRLGYGYGVDRRSPKTGVVQSIIVGSSGRAGINIGQGEMLPVNFTNTLKGLSTQVLGSDQTDLGRMDADGYPISTLTAGILMAGIGGGNGACYDNEEYTLAWPSTRSNFKLSLQAGGCTVVGTPVGSPTVSGGTGGNMAVQPTPGTAGVVRFNFANSTLAAVFPAGAFYAPGSGEIFLGRTSDYVLWQAGQNFTPEFIASLKDLTLQFDRTMGWCNSGDQAFSNETTWAHRMPKTCRSFYSQYFHPGIWCGVASGTNTYTCALPPDSSAGAWVDGEQFTVIFANPNTSSAITLQPTGKSSAKSVIDGVLMAALGDGNIGSNTPYTFTYNKVLDKLLMHAGGLSAAVPWEVQAELANLVGCDPWTTFPVMATNSYITGVATVMRDTLNANRLWITEGPNEDWNPAFPNTKFSVAMGQAFGWNTSSNQDVYGFYGLKVAQWMGGLIPTVFAGKMNRVCRVLAYQGAGDQSNWTNRFEGSQLVPGNAAYDLYTGGANYSAKPNRPVDCVEVFAYAPYAGGSYLCYGGDILDGHVPVAENEAAGLQAIVDAVDAGNVALAVSLVDADVRDGRVGVQNITASGDIATMTNDHGFVLGERVDADALSGTVYSGLTAGEIYSVAAIPTSKSFKLKALLGNNETGGFINFGTAGTGTTRIGRIARTMRGVSPFHRFAEMSAARYDADRPAGMSIIRLKCYEQNLEPRGPSSSQCSDLGLTGSDPTTSIATAVAWWWLDSASRFAQYDLMRQTMGTDPSNELTYGLMAHAGAPSQLVFLGGGDYGMINGYKSTDTPRQSYYGFKAFSSGGAPAITAPSPFTSSMWTASTTAIVIKTLPDKQGSAFTKVDYRKNGGPWTLLTNAPAAGTFPIGATAGDTIELESTNGIGSSAASDVKTVAAYAKAYAFLGDAEESTGYVVAQASVDFGSGACTAIVATACQNPHADPVITVPSLGLTATKIAEDAGYIQFWKIDIPAGSGVQNVVSTWDGSASYEFLDISVWKATGLTSTTPKQISAGTSSSSMTIAAVAGDYLFEQSWTGLTLSGSSEAPARLAAYGSRGLSADWTIVATDASFVVNTGNASHRTLAITLS